MKPKSTPDVPAGLEEREKAPKLSLEKVEKGRSMWELLLQLRVLLPYLSRLLPLLDGGLLKSSPDFTEVHKTIADMQTGSRELEVMARNHAVQLERIEQQMSRLRVIHENSVEESRIFYADMRSLRRWMISLSLIVTLLLVSVVGLLVYMFLHS
jgi:hypothetical protein